MSQELAADQQTSPTTSSAVEGNDPGYIEWNGYRYSRLAVQAMWAYVRDFDQLFRERPGQWVAYHGKERVGFASTQLALYQECLRRGYRCDDFIVCCIEPEEPGLIMPPPLD